MRICGTLPGVLRRGVTAAAGWLRALSGDDAYERYLTHHARAHEGAPLSRRDFYARREAAKWSGISRCC
ncbi:MAG TPA: YbdD/YjiX family protein [Steroidobacteraceae bacterium]|nr:YbdD/YjiX family protein [Steroidobacteraceae bacterium]